MVFIGLHCNNAITFRIADIVYLLLYIVSNRAFRNLFAVLSDKNDVYF
ncbi:hypothetical protein SAMN02910262_00734 [[Clostridium] aminophilum]|uniref:Uncharacterized protein n=1 Tax=[Clostridium] aminophilum TaxID=1526 RepID=A0A1I6ITM4_9FIRM|nr:hypothetical protein SAMN02910262_00734 [[Clostridium] aminophilum]